MNLWENELKKRLQRIETAGCYRQLHPVEGAVGSALTRNGKKLINLSSNNYLGFAGLKEVQDGARQALERGGSSTASRLIVGTDEATVNLEKEIAAWKGKEAALLFGSGFLANIGVLSSLLRRGDAVFSDELNHASIIDGIRLSHAERYRYRHRDMGQLEQQLVDAETRGIQHKLIVSDSVFSMDGDEAPLLQLIELKKKYGAALILDEAHASGVWGAEGAGLAHHYGVADEVDLLMGTFSKAFGAYGAYVAGERVWIDYLINSARSFIYTTALPPATIGTIAAALEVVRSAEERRCMLKQKADWFRTHLRERGWETAGSTTQIIPLLIGSSERAMKVSQQLIDEGILAVAIRPPTVPAGRARLRFSLMATHTEEELEHVVKVLARMSVPSSI
ncbi:8-amino-7-oxononanoate synthase [Mechercharimyces sp. CAU 1602]|uniref:8-amino-7-oxononanoate synthase n=1 Tax=Mechercharimyces sp. CAU 1602 TaxID=2973933 RepID=UPI0037C7CDD6